ncbi:hypothetical protein B4080_3743 [Bacillus cereus]|nr:hypothetical protein B4080_3743 [Bacillus cereus]
MLGEIIKEISNFFDHFYFPYSIGLIVLENLNFERGINKYE